MTEHAIIKSQQQSAVIPWASRQDVREMEERLKTMLPGAQKLNTMELFGLAQAAVAHNLDPFNGELWCIPGKGLMAGIKGHRRAAHRQINEEASGNGNYYVEFSQIATDEMTALKIPQKALAFRCRLHDSQTTRAYVDSIERMLRASMPWETVSKIMGERPYTEGVGYYVDGEATKMTPVQCAQKRAEADALKRRFDLPFTMAIGVNGDSDVIDAEFTVNVPEQNPAEVQARMQAASKTLRGDQGDIDLAPDWKQEQAPPEVCWSIETASEILTPKGARLGDCTPDQLIILTERGAGEMKDAAGFLLRQIENNKQTAEVEV